MRCRFGGVTVGFEGLGRELEPEFRARYGAFQDSSAVLPETIRVLLRGKTGPRGTVSDVRSRSDRRNETFTRTDFSLQISRTHRKHNLRVAKNVYSLDSALRVFLSRVLPVRQGLLLHAAGLIKDGRGFVFPGRSGAGKSTLVRQSPGGEALSDELVIVQKRQNRYHCYGTPFWGELAQAGRPLSAPLQALCFLKKGKTLSFQRLTPAAVIQRALAAVMHFSSQTQAAENVLDCLWDLTERVAGFELTFPKGKSVWPLLERLPCS